MSTEEYSEDYYDDTNDETETDETDDTNDDETETDDEDETNITNIPLQPGQLPPLPSLTVPSQTPNLTVPSQTPNLTVPSQTPNLVSEVDDISSTQPQRNLKPPVTICLKGKKNTLGASLELAGSDIVYIGRNFNLGGWKLPKSKWNNPFSVKKYGRDGAIQKYKEYILTSPLLINSLPELANKQLSCWCSPDACHGDVLVELFNERLLGIKTKPVPTLPKQTPMSLESQNQSQNQQKTSLGNLPALRTTSTEQTLPPPIPPEMKRPSPVRLNIQKPPPSMTVVSPNNEPKPLTTNPIQLTTPTMVQPPTLEDMLTKSEEETQDHFAIRSAYSRAAMHIFNNQINSSTAILIGRMAANKAIYGASYPEASERVIQYINLHLNKQL